MENDIYNPSANNAIINSMSSGGSSLKQTAVSFDDNDTKNVSTMSDTSTPSIQNNGIKDGIFNIITKIYLFFTMLPSWLIIILCILLFLYLIYLIIIIFQSRKNVSIIFFIIKCLFVVFLEILFVDILFIIIQRHIFTEKKMKIYDYIWYSLFSIIVLLFLATIIKSISNNFNVRTNLLLTMLGFIIILFYYTLVYYSIKHIDNISKIFFFTSLVIIALTCLFILLSYIFPNVIDIFNLHIVYGFFVSCYAILLCIILFRFLYKSITKPSTILESLSYFNMFKHTGIHTYIPLGNIF